MTMTNPYCSLEAFKLRVGITDADIELDTTLEALIEAASRSIDAATERRFYRVTETRTYTAEWPDLLMLPDDLASVTTLKTDDDGDRVYEITWATTDYDLEPHNAGLDAAPYTRISLAPNGTRSFPTGRKAVQIAGSFGYSAITALPPAITEACLLLAARLYKRREAPFGVAGSVELGVVTVISRNDPDVGTLIAPYRRPVQAWAV